jgi:hypothetical protein
VKSLTWLIGMGILILAGAEFEATRINVVGMN